MASGLEQFVGNHYALRMKQTLSRAPRVLAAGDAALTIEFGSTIDPASNARVVACARVVEGLSIPGVVEIVPTYRSLTVYFDPIAIDSAWLAERLEALARSVPADALRSSRTVEIPVLYGGEYGPDLPDVAAFAKRRIEDVIALHGSVTYRVYMLGFSPGFPYMGQVPDEIAMPRLGSPRMRVPAGSVGIAGSQTGIYPIESPGGWRLIGRTPLRLYDPNRPTPFLLKPEDCVRLVAIDRQEYDRLSQENG
ncbi:MAG: 5-oxoprolinase subunit PxpB [Nitrospiraceae bacterium]